MGAPADTDRAAARVLVVEDSSAIREMVVDALASAGYAADGRVDGEGLEEALDGYRPDLVIVDIMLPGRDGFALADVVRQWGDVGLIMLTARDGLTDRLRGLDGGADDYVVKPSRCPNSCPGSGPCCAGEGACLRPCRPVTSSSIAVPASRRAPACPSI